jgi:hypothetical protein
MLQMEEWNKNVSPLLKNGGLCLEGTPKWALVAVTLHKLKKVSDA